MPGIVGVISKTARPDGEEIARRMVESMVHESFYVSGNFSVRELGVFGGWIALEKSFAALQPFFNERKDIVALLSGEIYAPNFLVQGYEAEGENVFQNLNGLFSGLLIDRSKGQTFLFNDRFGFERLYVVEREDVTYFASEAKALLRVLPELRQFNRDGVVDLLAFGCTIENRTLFREVGLLPAGSLWKFENGGCRKKNYFAPRLWEAQPGLGAEEFRAAFNQTLAAISPKYFESTPAISLTAGLDTRMLLGSRPSSAREFECYTYDGATGRTLDSELASEIANECGYHHRLLRLGPDFFRDFSEVADRAAFLTDGSLGPTGAHEIYLSRAAREIAPIRLTGVFGGEILRGVSTFHPLNLANELLSPQVRKEVEDRGATLRSKDDNPVTFAAFKEIPWNIFGSVAACRSQLSFRTPFLDNDLVALAYRLPSPLRESAESAVRFIQNQDPSLARIPTDMGLLGNASARSRLWHRFFAKATFKLDYWTNDGMPDWLAAIEPKSNVLNWRPPGCGHHKYLRYRRWFRHELRSYVCERLAAPSLRESGFFHEEFLDTLAENHVAGRGNYVQEINVVLMIEAVQRLLLKT